MKYKATVSEVVSEAGRAELSTTPPVRPNQGASGDGPASLLFQRLGLDHERHDPEGSKAVRDVNGSINAVHVEQARKMRQMGR